jgi:hypothetical protein
VRGQVLTAASTDVIAMLEDATQELATLTPDQPHAAFHEAITALLADTMARWVAVDPSRVDLLIGQLLTADLRDIVCVRSADVHAAVALLLGAVPDAVAPAYAAVWLDDPDAGCAEG